MRGEERGRRGVCEVWGVVRGRGKEREGEGEGGPIV